MNWRIRNALPYFPSALVLALCGTLATAAYGESDYERDLKQLIERRNAAVAAVAVPVNSRFKSDAEQLLLRATQSRNEEAVKKIKAMIEAAALHPTEEIKDLRKQLKGTSWKATNPNQVRPGLGATLTFSDTTVDPGSYLYEVDTHNTVTILFKGGDRQVMVLSKDGRQMKLTLATVEYVYDLASP